jgi:hypothetical protein
MEMASQGGGKPDKASTPPRFLVREGCKGWMVYDRQRKGPALVGTDPAVNLTEEQAYQIKQALVAEQERKHST